MGNAKLPFWQKQSGKLYITDLFRILVIMCLLFSFIYLPRPFIKYIQLSNLCENIVHNIEVSGAVTVETHRLIADLKAVYKIEPQIIIEGNFIDFNGERRIQYQERFTVTVEDRVELKIFRPSFSNTIIIGLPLRKSLAGVSHVYWRKNQI